LIIDIKESRHLALFVVGTHVAGLATPWWADIHWVAALVTSGAVVLSLCHTFRRYVARTDAGAIVALELSDQGVMHVTHRGGDRRRVQRVTSLWANPLATALTVRLEGRRWPRKLVIPADAVDRERYRLLRIQLAQLGLAD
jgi:hypothetical protein